MFIVKCIPEDVRERPFGVFIDRPITLGMDIRPGGGVYVVTAITLTDEPDPTVEYVTIRKVDDHSDNICSSTAAAPLPSRSNLLRTDTA